VVGTREMTYQPHGRSGSALAIGAIRSVTGIRAVAGFGKQTISSGWLCGWSSRVMAPGVIELLVTCALTSWGNSTGVIAKSALNQVPSP
jgi:hypothetical protein